MNTYVVMQTLLFFYDGGPYHIETKANQWTAEQINGLVLYDRDLRHEKVNGCF